MSALTAIKYHSTKADGADNAGGKVYTYAAGTTTPQATYTTAARTTPNANPVVLDSTGRASIYLDPTLAYKFVALDSAGVPVPEGTVDNWRLDGIADLTSTVSGKGADIVGLNGIDGFSSVGQWAREQNPASGAVRGPFLGDWAGTATGRDFRAPSDAHGFQGDIVPTYHLKALNAAATPTVVLVGDSISTYFANSVARSDMLPEVLRRTLETQFPNGVNFKNRAIGGKRWADVMTVQYQTYIPWYSGFATTTWLDMVKALNPDLVIFSFGMNDGSSISAASMKAVLDDVQSWTKVPSIVVATNLTPNPQSTTFPEGDTGQENRDKAAGFIRSYARFRKVGLLDVHRKHCMVRDGFDPTSSCIVKGDVGLTPTSNQIVGTVNCYDWKIRISFNSSALSATQYITVRTGVGANDFIQILQPSANQLQIAAYAGGVDSIAYFSQTVPYTFTAGTAYQLVIEKSDSFISIYNDTDSQYGTFNEPAMWFRCVSLGGLYMPVIQANVGGLLALADIAYGEQRINTPSISNALLWGNETPSAIDEHGGSGYNHPGGFMATHVYRPLIQGFQWHLQRPPVGTVAVSSGVSSVTVTLPNAEIADSYYVDLAWEGNWPGVGFYVGSKTTTNFVVNFTGATLNACTLVWALKRKY